MANDERQRLESARRRALSPSLDQSEYVPTAPVVHTEFGSCSHTGPRRRVNEDHFLILRVGRNQDVIASSLAASDLPQHFEEFAYAMVVADGSGDMGGGALASRIAISTLAHMAIRHGKWNVRLDHESIASIGRQAEFFHRQAERAIAQQRLSAPFLADIHATLTATFSVGDTLFFAHVGDSRAYLVRDGAATRLTRDHAEVPSEDGVPALDVEHIRLFDNDVVVVCTNGLAGALSAEAIAEVLATPRGLNEQCQQLVEWAERDGASDDMTVVACKYAIRPAAVVTKTV